MRQYEWLCSQWGLVRPTTDRWLFVLLENIVHEAEHEGGLMPSDGLASEMISEKGILEAQENHTLPTAASPSSTSLTLLLGFGGAAVVSAMLMEWN